MVAGVWRLADTTVVANVTSATFEAFAKLCNGEFGSRPLQADHTLVAVNPSWGKTAEGIGQLWEWKLKQQVRARRMTDVRQMAAQMHESRHQWILAAEALL